MEALIYSQKIIAGKAAKIEAQFPIKLREYTVPEIEYWVDRLGRLIHPDSTENNPKLVRSLSEEEQLFVTNEVFMCKISYPYWAPRYAFIKYDKGGVARLRLAESQEMLLSVLASLEEAGKPAKILNLKARQIYSSTFSETVLTHKAMNIPGITSIVASDEPDKSEFLFNMMERIYDNLPFYLKPHKKFRVKGSQLYFDDMDSLIDVDSGNKRVGGIGQGMTVHAGHLSELATWDNTDQITADLIPAIISGESINTFFIMESTANGKWGFLYEAWLAAKQKKFYDFVPVFIPWWIMKEKYANEPEIGWGPSDRVLKLALQIKSTKGVELTRKQMFWWDKYYASYKERDKLNEFFAEYASDDQEAFQLAGKTVFPTERLNDMLREAKTRVPGVYELQEKMVRK